MWSIAALAVGYVLDLIVGDPHWLPHPIRLIGRLISLGESLTRRAFPKTKKGELAAGGVLCFVVLVVCWGGTALLLWGAYWLNTWLGFSLEAVLCFYALATKSLRVESMKVYLPLKEGRLEDARTAVSMIVGRDTQRLDSTGVAKAAVETVAENTSDGVIAPLFYLVLGGAPLGYLYKGINTMDSMIGYKNDCYLYFGRVAARLDDIANFLPSRLSALLMLLASMITGFDWKNGWKIFKRDRFNHKSPNSAQTEAVCAGVLQVQLAGSSYYFGKLVEKPTIGDKLRAVVPEDIPRANRLLYGTSILGFSFGIAIKLLFILLI